MKDHLIIIIALLLLGMTYSCNKINESHNELTKTIITDSIKLSEDDLLIIVKEIDSANSLNDDSYYIQKEYVSLKKINKNGEWKVSIPKTDILEQLCQTYIHVNSFDLNSTVYIPCKSGAPKIVIHKGNDNRFYLNYQNDSSFSREIISSYMTDNINETSIAQNYNGRYIQIWLKDTIDNKTDSRFLAIGSANHKFIREFHFPKEYKTRGLFISEKDLTNADLNIIEEECE